MLFTKLKQLVGAAAPILLSLPLMVFSPAASAHKSSDAYLQFQASPGSLQLRWDIALRDLDVELDIDTNADGVLTWAEVKQSLPKIEAYALAHIAIDGCALKPAGTALERRSDGAYAVLFLKSDCDLISLLGVHYGLFSDVDTTHRGIAKLQRTGQAVEVLLLDPSGFRAAHARPGSVESSQLHQARSDRTSAGQFLLEGVHHILSGYDHLLFLFCLVLTAPIQRTGKVWRAVGDRRAVILSTAGILTAFTVAHSITLALSALKIASVPPAVVEPAIAATIVLTAVDNLVPIFPLRRSIVAFCFGLIHGFGFASALSELELEVTRFVVALLEFNVGLEIGQLTAMSVALFLLYRLRRWRWYEVVVIGGGSIVAIAISTLWFVERF
ncbi:hypothetical protein J2X20_005898 [Pelomonas saccharophila]|uniref:HupE/UreJ family protein n=1 Tax=Roseateles saccharophilus TaxID=304 RepID=A0ABU1YWV2_ROSSA|nr:HupE/UreJ family protein [Roseateles saccharophilus]MDR7273208.1 hypothetical protein [Roseateles saccharophilus]